jgi:hypothetical protein
MSVLGKIRGGLGKRRRAKEREARMRALADAFAEPALPVMLVEYDTQTVGMFAQLSACLKSAEAAEHYGKRVVMRLVSPNYREADDKPDWFSAYFVNKALADLPQGQAPIILRESGELPFGARFASRCEARDTFVRHFAIRPEIEAEVDAFATAHAIGPHTLCLHYRGTDKFNEAPAQAIDDVIERVTRYAQSLEGVRNLFVASDQAAFVERALAGIAGLPVVVMDDSLRSDGDTPLHTAKLRAGNRAMARDAILNCMVLARGGWLCRTSSFLSAWSAVFNPRIALASLNAPYDEKTWRLETVVQEDSLRI